MKNDSSLVGKGGAVEIENENPLPKCLPGAVCKQFVTRGGKCYGPYWYRFYRESGRLKKRYVRPCDLESVSHACERHRLHRKQDADMNSKRRLLKQELGGIVRLIDCLEKVERGESLSDDDVRDLEQASERLGNL